MATLTRTKEFVDKTGAVRAILFTSANGTQKLAVVRDVTLNSLAETAGFLEEKK